MNNAFTLYGEPAKNIVSNYVRQNYSDTCAIKSQQLVLERFGINISEEQLRSEAISHGWYTPGGGTSMENVGKLLELHGVNVHQYVNGNIFNLVNELAQGHNVIMGVDSGELWHYGFWEKLEDYLLGGERADHALIVSGIDASDPNDVKIIITDPGTGEYCKEYSFAQFVDAAQDSNFFMVTTDTPEPNIFDGFGHNIDHLPFIGWLPYQEFYDNYAFLHSVSEDNLASFMSHANTNIYDDILDHIFSDWSNSDRLDCIDMIDDSGIDSEIDDDICDMLDDIDVKFLKTFISYNYDFR